MGPYKAGDEQALVDLLTHPDITKTFMVPSYTSYEQYLSLAQKLIGFGQVEDTTHLEYGIFLEDKLIGFINDCGIEEDTLEIGYVIHPDYQGQGYATEAVHAVLDVLRDMGFRKVAAGYFEENPASCRVMEKCGMHKTDITEVEEYRGESHICFYYEICF